MKTCTFLAIGFLLAFVILDSKGLPWSNAAPIQTSKKTSAVVSLSSKPLPQSVLKWARKRDVPIDADLESKYQAAMETMPQWHFRARVIQHLNDGYLLVELVDWQEKDFPRTQNFAVFNHPDYDTTVDRQIINVRGCIAGTFTYPTIDGANRTITEVVYMEKEIPRPAPSPGAWMSDPNRRSALDRHR